MKAVERFDPAKGAKLFDLLLPGGSSKPSKRAAGPINPRPFVLPVHMVDKISRMQLGPARRLHEELGR